jgi:xanthine dehydrogenase iron-sulfur cluster and FAD-binding subunit A
MIMAAHGLLQRKNGPVERDEVIDALGGHICRCTGYVKIVNAVMAASRGEVDVSELDKMLEPEAEEPEVEIKGAPA